MKAKFLFKDNGVWYIGSPAEYKRHKGEKKIVIGNTTEVHRNKGRGNKQYPYGGDSHKYPIDTRKRRYPL